MFTCPVKVAVKIHKTKSLQVISGIPCFFRKENYVFITLIARLSPRRICSRYCLIT